MINFDCQELTRRAAVTLGTSQPPGDLVCYQSKKENSMRRSMIAVLFIASAIPANGPKGQHEAGKQRCQDARSHHAKHAA